MKQKPKLKIQIPSYGETPHSSSSIYGQNYTMQNNNYNNYNSIRGEPKSAKNTLMPRIANTSTRSSFVNNMGNNSNDMLPLFNKSSPKHDMINTTTNRPLSISKLNLTNNQ